jgi:DNA-directed RNA polymerase specialized sigma24 family protein
MTDLEGQVCQLLFEKGVSSREAAKQLQISPGEVVSIATHARKASPPGNHKTEPSQPTTAKPLSEQEQIKQLRRQVRYGLLERTKPGAIEDIPATALVRLWQLIEDPSLLGKGGQVEDPFEEVIPEEVRQAIFRILDEQ